MEQNNKSQSNECMCYTVNDLMTILDMSRPTVHQLLAKKEFHWFRVCGGRYRISRKSFDAWLNGEA